MAKGLFIPVDYDLDQAIAAIKKFKAEQQKHGEETADAFLKGHKAEFARRKAEIKEAQLRGMITKEEAKKQGKEAAEAFNKEILAKLAELRKAGKASTDEFNNLQKSLKNVAVTGSQDINKGFLRQFAQLPSLIRGTVAVGILGAFGFIANGIINGFRGVAQGIADILKRGAELAQIGGAFRSQATSQGIIPDELLRELRRGTRGMVDDVELMRRANRALQAELPATARQFGLLAEGARRLGDATGIDAAQAFELLVESIAKGQDRGLKSLGLFVDMTDVMKKWEAQTGRNASSLSETERRTLLLNAVLDALRTKLQQLGPDTLEPAERMQQIATAMTNLRNEIALAITTSPRLVQFFNDLGGSAEDSAERIEDIADRIGAAIDVMIERLVRAGNLARGVARFIGQLPGIGPLVRLPFTTADLLTGGGPGAPAFEDALARRRREREEQRKRDAEAAGKGSPRTGGGTGGFGADDPGKASRLAEERIRLQERLADELARLTDSAVDEAINALTRLEEEWVEKFGHMDDATGNAFARIRKHIEAGGSLEEFRDKLREISDTPIDTVEEAADATIALQELLRTVEEEAAKLEEGSKVRKQYNDLLREGQKLQQRIGDAAVASAEKQKKAEQELLDLEGRITGGRKERLREIREEARQLEEYARSAIQVAEAIGLIDSSAAKALENVAQLGSAIARIAAGDFSAIPAAIGAGASLASSIFGDSPAERARKRALQENTEALDKMRLALEGFRVTQDVLAQAQRATAQALALEGVIGKGGLGASAGTKAALEIFAKAGISLGKLKEIADSLGIKLFDEAGRIIAGSLKQLNEALGLATDALTGFFDTLDSRRQEADLEADIFDQTQDAAAKLNRELRLLSKFSPAIGQRFAGADPTTPAGRAAIEAQVRELFRLFQSGTLDIGGLTREEFLSLLENIEGSLDELSEAAGGESGTGETTGFEVRRSITEVTANRMIGTLTTISYHAERTARATEGMYAALRGQALGPLPMPNLPGTSVGGASLPLPSTLPVSGGPAGVSMSSSFAGAVFQFGPNTFANATPETGRRFGQEAGVGFMDAVDRHIEERRKNLTRASGMN